MHGYWDSVVKARMTRRRVLAGASAGAGLAALSLAGCGGDDDEGSTSTATGSTTSTTSSSSAASTGATGASGATGSTGSGGSTGATGSSGLLSPRIDTTAQAKRGGILQTVQASELASLDALKAPQAGTTGVAAGFLYGRLLKFKPGIIDPPVGEIEGDLAEDWELSPDRLTLTFKLRHGVKLDSRPPTNGRDVNAQDVLFSAEKVKAGGDYRTDLFHELNELAPVESFSAPDDYTVVVKLASPDSLILSYLATGRIITIQPVEADGGFDPQKEARGWGPWRVKELLASQKVEYERNPDYYVPGIPYLDGISSPFINEYATLMAQFRAGNIWTGVPVRSEDIISTKSDLPELLLFEDEFPRNGIRGKFGIKDPESPFKDQRVRQAFSMLMDRQLLIDTLMNVDELRTSGLPLETRWNSCMWCGWEGAWLDPQGSDFGPNAKYYEFNPEEAKSLLSAAGYPDGFSFDFIFAADAYGEAYQRYAEALAGEWNNAGVGVTANVDPQPYQAVFFPTVGKGKGDFPGFGLQSGAAQGSPQEFLRAYYHSQGAFGIDAPAFTTETDIDDLLTEMKLEFDSDAQLEMQKEFQRVMAERVRMILNPGSAPNLSLTWPWVGNAGVYRQYDAWAGLGTENMPYLWLDESKR